MGIPGYPQSDPENHDYIAGNDHVIVGVKCKIRHVGTRKMGAAQWIGADPLHCLGMSRWSFEHILLHAHFGLLVNNGSGQWQARQQRNPPAARKRPVF